MEDTTDRRRARALSSSSPERRSPALQLSEVEEILEQSAMVSQEESSAGLVASSEASERDGEDDSHDASAASATEEDSSDTMTESQEDVISAAAGGREERRSSLVRGFWACLSPVAALWKGREVRSKGGEAGEGDSGFEIAFTDIKVQDLIGSGAQGTVFGGLYRGEIVAVKKVKDRSYCDEICRLRKLSHRNIVQFRGVCIESPCFCVVMEYCPQGNLYDFIRREEILPPQVVGWARQIADGMLYLHSKKIIHRDLKSLNILMCDNDSVKISDFGTSRTIGEDSTRMTFAGTVGWMSPEMLRHDPCSEKVDVWSYAVLLWEMLTQEKPYSNVCASAIIWGVGSNKLHLPIPSTCPSGLKALLEMCWQQKPKNRPTFRQILIHLDIAAGAFLSIPPEKYLQSQVDWRAEIEVHLSKIQQEGLSPLHGDNDLVEQREAELRHAQDMRQMYEQRLRNATRLYRRLSTCKKEMDAKELQLLRKEEKLNTMMNKLQRHEHPTGHAIFESSDSTDDVDISRLPPSHPPHSPPLHTRKIVTIETPPTYRKKTLARRKRRSVDFLSPERETPPHVPLTHIPFQQPPNGRIKNPTTPKQSSEGPILSRERPPVRHSPPKDLVLPGTGCVDESIAVERGTTKSDDSIEPPITPGGSVTPAIDEFIKSVQKVPFRTHRRTGSGGSVTGLSRSQTRGPPAQDTQSLREGQSSNDKPHPLQGTEIPPPKPKVYATLSHESSCEVTGTDGHDADSESDCSETEGVRKEQFNTNFLTLSLSPTPTFSASPHPPSSPTTVSDHTNVSPLSSLASPVPPDFPSPTEHTDGVTTDTLTRVTTDTITPRELTPAAPETCEEEDDEQREMNSAATAEQASRARADDQDDDEGKTELTSHPGQVALLISQFEVSGNETGGEGRGGGGGGGDGGTDDWSIDGRFPSDSPRLEIPLHIRRNHYHHQQRQHRTQSCGSHSPVRVEQALPGPVFHDHGLSNSTSIVRHFFENIVTKGLPEGRVYRTYSTTELEDSGFQSPLAGAL